MFDLGMVATLFVEKVLDKCLLRLTKRDHAVGPLRTDGRTQSGNELIDERDGFSAICSRLALVVDGAWNVLEPNTTVLGRWRGEGEEVVLVVQPVAERDQSF